MSGANYFTKLDESGAPKIYEDERVAAFLSPEPACGGHIILVPKEQYIILEQVPDYDVAHLFHVANKLSVAAFDSLGAMGTNLLIQNGTAAGQKESHMCIHILPRREGDGLNFGWNPKQLSEEEMSTIELQLKDICSNIGGFQTEESAPVVVDTPEVKVVESNDGEEDLREKQLFRIP